jgi:hypothetical protein
MILFPVLMMGAPLAIEPARNMPVINPIAESRMCPDTPMSLARKMGKKVTRAIPLTELPPATTFMAVDRRVDGCPAPLTASEYRGR